MANPSDTRKSASEVLSDEQIKEIVEEIVAGGRPDCPLCGNPLCVGPREFIRLFGNVRFSCGDCKYIFK